MASFVFHTADGSTVRHTIECDTCNAPIPHGEKVYVHKKWKLNLACEICYQDNKAGYVHFVRVELEK